MTGHRKHERKQPASYTCLDCDARSHLTRKDAKAAARRYPAERLHDYPCPTGNGYHVGRLATVVSHGDMTRDDFYDGRRNAQMQGASR